MTDCLGWVRINKATNKAEPKIYDTWHDANGACTGSATVFSGPRVVSTADSFYIVPVVVHKDYCHVE